MKVQPNFSLEGNRIEKAIHQEAFSSPYTTMHVNAARNRRPIDQFFESIRPLTFVRRPFRSTSLQRIDRTQLRRITCIAACSEFRLIR
jgi:hypothetical protein